MLDEPDEAEMADAATEARVRRSLGLGPTGTSPLNNKPSHASGHASGHSSGHSSGHQANGHGPSGGNGLGQPRRRFVRDGEVPVVVLHAKSETENRQATALADMTRQRDSERAARLRAESALHEAQSAILGLQTRLAHAEMAHAEMKHDDRPAAQPEPVAMAQVAMAPVAMAGDAPEAMAPDAGTGDPAAAFHTPAEPDQVPEPKLRRTRSATPPAEPEAPQPEPEPEPVKWWRDTPTQARPAAGRRTRP